MRDFIEKRAVELAIYIIKTKCTVREAAKVFGISKSTVHKDVAERLQHINHDIYYKVRDVLDLNKDERHIRGGMATKNKFKHI